MKHDVFESEGFLSRIAGVYDATERTDTVIGFTFGVFGKTSRDKSSQLDFPPKTRKENASASPNFVEVTEPLRR